MKYFYPLALVVLSCSCSIGLTASMYDGTPRSRKEVARVSTEVDRHPSYSLIELDGCPIWLADQLDVLPGSHRLLMSAQGGPYLLGVGDYPCDKVMLVDVELLAGKKYEWVVLSNQDTAQIALRETPLGVIVGRSRALAPTEAEDLRRRIDLYRNAARKES